MTESAAMELRGKRVMVVGLGISGNAAAQFLAARGASLVLTDIKRDLPLSNLPDTELHLGGEDSAWLRGVDLVVVSPGVPPASVLLQASRAAGILVIGELELASHFIKFPVVAVTGTNGKSTVTTLLGEICRNAGLNTFVGGNLGTPLVKAAGGDFDLAVVEASSYQLESIRRFRPAAAIHLNVSDDHLDRYRGLEEYGRAKARIFENQKQTDWAILNRDDPEVWKLRHQVRARVLSFGFSQPQVTPAIWQESGGWGSISQDQHLHFDLTGAGFQPVFNGTIGMDGFGLPGAFNRANAMAATGAALVLKLAPEIIERTLAEFRGLPHRLEFVREKGGVTYLDDSKATNVGAVVRALAAIPAPVILLAGGVDKGGSYAPLRQPVQQKVRIVLLYGAARETIRAALAGSSRIECVECLGEAVQRAAAEAISGDTVLLSPACASFDQFKDYAERGRVFQGLVRAL
jgi:UDP-N-acetylmuramoylalanine--D-glutamate ligase